MLVPLLVFVGGTGSAVEGDCTVAAAGDVAGADFSTGAAETALLIDAAAPRKVLALGDLAYEDGTAAEFAAYYDPTWGLFKTITRPVPGNHEYHSGGDGYFGYFDVAPYYAFNTCGWRAVALNTEIDHAEQISFLKSQHESYPDRPLLVYWHKPRWSSGEHGDSPAQQDFWKAAVNVGADLVLNGHEHDYERFARMDAAGNADATGPREFVVGTGGHEVRGFSSIEPNSQEHVTGQPGVLLLTLTNSSYAWKYRNTLGTQDSGKRHVDLNP